MILKLWFHRAGAIDKENVEKMSSEGDRLIMRCGSVRMWDFNGSEQFITCFSNAFSQKRSNQRGYHLVVDGFRWFVHIRREIQQYSDNLDEDLSQIWCMFLKKRYIFVISGSLIEWSYTPIC